MVHSALCASQSIRIRSLCNILMRVQVSNEMLMQTNIRNLTTSEAAFVRLRIDVQAEGVTPEVVQDLTKMMKDMMDQEGLRRLFDNEYQPHAAIKSTGGDPLRFQVRVFDSQVESTSGLHCCNIAALCLQLQPAATGLDSCPAPRYKVSDAWCGYALCRAAI